MSVNHDKTETLMQGVSDILRKCNFTIPPQWKLTSLGHRSLEVEDTDPKKVFRNFSINVHHEGNTISIVNGHTVYKNLTLEEFTSTIKRLCSYTITPPSQAHHYDIAIILRSKGSNDVVVENRGNFAGFPFFTKIFYKNLDDNFGKLGLGNGSLKMFGKVLSSELIVIMQTDEDLSEFMSKVRRSTDPNFNVKKIYEILDISKTLRSGPTESFSAFSFNLLKDLYNEMWPIIASPMHADMPLAHQNPALPNPYPIMPLAHQNPNLKPFFDRNLPPPTVKDKIAVVILSGRAEAKKLFMENANDPSEGPFSRFPFFDGISYSTMADKLTSQFGVDFRHENRYRVARISDGNYCILVHPIDDTMANRIKLFINDNPVFVGNGLVFADKNFKEMYRIAKNVENDKRISRFAAAILTRFINEDGSFKR
jgi:hypothetical protein